MIAVLDAAYSDMASAVACVTAQGWRDARPLDEIVLRRGPQKAYASGEFYRRELPLLLGALKKLNAPPPASKQTRRRRMSAGFMASTAFPC